MAISLMYFPSVKGGIFIAYSSEHAEHNGDKWILGYGNRLVAKTHICQLSAHKPYNQFPSMHTPLILSLSTLST